MKPVNDVLDAGGDQTIVIYSSEDTGSDIDPADLFERIAADASARAAAGQRIVSMTAIPEGYFEEHSLFTRESSGFTTKFAVAVVYARP